MASFLNNRFLKDDEALLHVSDLSMQRGYAIFDFCRTINGIPLYLSDHLDRFYGCAAAMHLMVEQKKEELVAIIHELIQRSSLPQAGIRIMLTGGYAADGYHPADPNLVLTCNPVKVATEADFEKGYSVITRQHQRELPHIKSINYLTAVWLQPLLKEKKADDVLYHFNNSITEFPRSNIFMVNESGTLITPARNMLKGITRKNIIALAAGSMKVEERDITVDELLTASEVFLTSTTKKIMPVLKIDDSIISDGKPGNITRELYREFCRLEKSLTQPG